MSSDSKMNVSSLKGLRINAHSYLLQTILSLSGQTRGGVSKGIFSRKVREEVAKIAKG